MNDSHSNIVVRNEHGDIKDDSEKKHNNSNDSFRMTGQMINAKNSDLNNLNINQFEAASNAHSFDASNKQERRSLNNIKIGAISPP
jgi:hypothetical protein